ncbi:MAG: energy transducer TonB [Bacteroidales bacterium]
MSIFSNKDKRSGLIGTIVFHAIILLLIITFGYSTPLPLPAEEGILINFGDSDEGIGEEEPMVNDQNNAQNAPEVSKTVNESAVDEADEGNITQDFEEAPVVKKEAKKTEQKTEKKEVKPQPNPEVKTETKTEVKKEQQVDTRALFPGRNPNSTSTSGEGETGKEGNQGSKTGSIDSENHTGGNSTGGKGYDFSLSGRNPESIPKPEYNYQIDGKVVVEITVDKQGTVTDAVPGVKGSTTLDANLLAAAKKAALLAKFDRKPDAPAYQKGTITYYFKLQ